MNSAWALGVAGAAGILGLVWYADRTPKSDDRNYGGIISTGNTDLGWQVVETVGTDADGVTYVVECHHWRTSTGEEYVPSTNGYRAARSNGQGGYMMFGTPNNSYGGNYDTFEGAKERAQEELDRANVDPADPYVGLDNGAIGGDTEYEVEAQNGQIDYSGALANVQDVTETAIDSAQGTINTSGLQSDLETIIVD